MPTKGCFMLSRMSVGGQAGEGSDTNSGEAHVGRLADSHPNGHGALRLSICVLPA